MSEILTAKQFLKFSETFEEDYTTISINDCEERMIEFARLHVEAALKEVTEKLYFRDSDGNCIKSEESNKLVLNAYPLINIK